MTHCCLVSFQIHQPVAMSRYRGLQGEAEGTAGPWTRYNAVRDLHGNKIPSLSRSGWSSALSLPCSLVTYEVRYKSVLLVDVKWRVCMTLRCTNQAIPTAATQYQCRSAMLPFSLPLALTNPFLVPCQRASRTHTRPVLGAHVRSLVGSSDTIRVCALNQGCGGKPCQTCCGSGAYQQTCRWGCGAVH